MQDRRITTRSHVTYYAGQCERGNGTDKLHFQVYVQASNKVKLDKWRAFFTFNGKQHHIVSPLNGTSDENIAYCTKEDTRETDALTEFNPVFAGEIPFSWGEARFIDRKKQGDRTDLSALKAAIENQDPMQKIYSEHFEAISKCANSAENYYNMIGQKKARDALIDYYNGIELRPWQKHLCEFVDSPVHPRQVVYIHESTGGVGKSFMAGYLQVMKNAVVLQPARKADLLYILSKYVRDPTCNTVVFDVSCSNAEYGMSVVYTVAEHLKDGRFLVTKYQSDQFAFKPKHVIIFSNEPPDLSAMKSDRWTVCHLQGLNLTMPSLIRRARPVLGDLN